MAKEQRMVVIVVGLGVGKLLEASRNVKKTQSFVSISFPCRKLWLEFHADRDRRGSLGTIFFILKRKVKL